MSLQEILKKYPIEPHVGVPPLNFKWISPQIARARNAALKAAGITEYTDELGHKWHIESGGKKGLRWRNLTGDRRLSEISLDPRTGKPGTRYAARRGRADRRIRGLIESNKTEAEINNRIRKIIAEFNSKLDPSDKEGMLVKKHIFEHRISQADWRRMGLPGNPADSHNIWVTTAREAKQKTRIESILRDQGKGQTHYVDYNPETRSFHVLPVEEFSVGKEAVGGLEITEAEWSAKDFNPKAKLNESTLRAVGRGETKSVGAAGRFGDLAPSSGLGNMDLEGRPFWNTIEDTLSKPFTLDPESEFAKLGIWHDGATLDDSWVKISRELNLESGKFDDATGVFHYSKDPTARTSIDVLSDIGQGEGEFGDIVNLKNKFHGLKRVLPPGEYYLHADNPTKAKYYQRVFANDPWIGPSGEQGGGRLKSGEYVKYDTLKLTVPERSDQFMQAQDGPYPRWQDQGVPQTDLNKDVGDIAKKYGMQMSDVSALGKAMRRAGSVLPFVGAGLDAWDVQQRWEEAMNNPNKGLADWLDKVQLGLATTTLGTSFWAEPANFALGMTNLGIDVARTFAEEEKREDFFRTMRAIGREGTRIARMAL